MLIAGTFDGKDISIQFNGEDKPCSLKVYYHAPFDMEIDRGEFKNPRSLSAQLRSEINYLECCKLLFAHNIPKESGLWALNHDGYPTEDMLKYLEMEQENVDR